MLLSYRLIRLNDGFHQDINSRVPYTVCCVLVYRTTASPEVNSVPSNPLYWTVQWTVYSTETHLMQQVSFFLEDNVSTISFSFNRWAKKDFWFIFCTFCACVNKTIQSTYFQDGLIQSIVHLFTFLLHFVNPYDLCLVKIKWFQSASSLLHG